MNNGNFGVCSNGTFQQLVRALNLPYLRINSDSGNWGSNPANIANFAANANKILPPSCTLMIGLYAGSPAAYQVVPDWWKTNGTIPCNYWEVGNETGGDYPSIYVPGQQGIHQSDPNFKVGGPAWAGADDGQLGNLIAANSASSLQFLSWHQYLYCRDQDPIPSDFQACLAQNPRSGANPFGGYMQAAQAKTAGTYAQNYPVCLDEYNIECGASQDDLRAGTSIGACFMVSSLMAYASTANQNQAWAGVWDLYDDSGAAYNIIDTGMNCYPQYYTLQQLIARMPGSMVYSQSGASGVQAWATKSGTSFGVVIVNANDSPVSGQVALSNWPLNSTGNATIHVWSLPTTNGEANVPGNLSTVGVSGGLTGSVTVQARSITMLFP